MRKNKRIFLSILHSFLWLTSAEAKEANVMYLKSSAWLPGEQIPALYTCNGRDISPPLEWGKIPEEAISLVLICDDPDAPKGTWDHWIVYNLPPTTSELLEDTKTLPENTAHGVNSWGNAEYGGPCPPDREHRYFFKLYALDIQLHFQKPPTKQEVEIAMKDHILAEAVLMGRYEQPSLLSGG